jgi:predicted dinucleotide-binding enzyme
MGVDFENPRRQIAILSIGDMGAGIARLLVAKGFRVITELTGRR